MTTTATATFAADMLGACTEFAGALASITGEPWTVGEYRADSWDKGVTLAGPDGMALYLSHDQYRGKVHVSGICPRDRSGQAYPYTHDRKASAVCVGPKRAAAAAARDVARRYLPDYRLDHERGREQIRAADAYADAADAAARALAAVNGDTRARRPHSPGDTPQVSYYNRTDGGSSYGDFKVYRDCCEATLHGVAHADAVEILKALSNPGKFRLTAVPVG